jgi:hypothetical protein
MTGNKSVCLQKMKRMRNLTLLLLLVSLQLQAQKTELKYLSGTGKDNTVNWDFQLTSGRNSGKWTTIAVPSNWELQGFGAYTYGKEKEDVNEAGLYKYAFTLPGTWVGQHIFIVFDGSMTDTEVKINGELAGPIHQGAFYRVRYDITKLLKFDRSNLLEVKVSKVSTDPSVNRAERAADYWVLGGIFRPVFLEAYPKQYLRHVDVDAKADGSIKVNAFPGEVSTISTITAQVSTRDGRNIGRPFQAVVHPGDSLVQLTGRVTDPALWSAEFPNLYKLNISLKNGSNFLYTVTETIGFRTIELRKHDGFYINGQKIRFKGINRGSFWPTTGRTTNKQISINDINLIKDMNMNAVRMSHYPPDKHFLDACDSLGLYILDELTGWQAHYDTDVGRKLVKELIQKDVNHTSVVMWANGNEGGFNFDLLPDYARYDIQQRPVVQPWSNFNGINTKHYIPWNYGINTFFQGNDVFFPTEFLHGLYDGGHGAGLDDYWNLMLSNPLSGGGFLWDFCDQGVVRTDKGGMLDTKGNAAADGILGPYREKEGSFFTVKEVWSPVYIQKRFIKDGFDGTFTLENRYNFTNLNRCSFSWRLKKLNGFNTSDTSAISGNISSPDIKPQASGTLQVHLPSQWEQYDILYITAKDVTGREIYTWSWPLTSPARMADRLVSKGAGKITVHDLDSNISMQANGVEVSIDKRTGLLQHVTNSKGSLAFANGPVLLTGAPVLRSIRHYDTVGVHIIEVNYDGKERFRLKWTMMPSGWVELNYQYRPDNLTEMLGVTFNYPENNVKGMQMIGNGPYRVYKNRLKGVTFNLWDKSYNNTITGETWNYPEFKGYYSNFYGARIITREGDFTVLTSTENMFLHMLNPQAPSGLNRANSMAVYPASGGISFMNGIPAIGTKTQKKEDLGPQSQPNITFANGGLDTMQGDLYFDFRLKYGPVR